MTYSDVIIIRLTQLCEERNITINKLANLSGITLSTVENIMPGKTKNPKLKTLYKLTFGLRMAVSELLNFLVKIIHRLRINKKTYYALIRPPNSKKPDFY